MHLQSNDGDSKALLYVVNVHLLIVPAKVACEDKPREDNSGPGKNRPRDAV